MVRRWTALGVVTAQKKFRRIKGYRHMGALVHALRSKQKSLDTMSLLPKSIHRCRRYPTKFNSGRDIPRNCGRRCYLFRMKCRNENALLRITDPLGKVKEALSLFHANR